MTNFIVGIIIGLLLGGAGVYLILRPKLNQNKSIEKVVVANKDEAEKRENGREDRFITKNTKQPTPWGV